MNIDKGNGIYAYIDVVNRDAYCTATDSMVSKSFILELNTIYDLTNNVEPLKNVYDNLFSDIKNVNENELLDDIKLPSYQKLNIHYITIDQLIKRYPTSTIKTALEMYVIANGPTVIWEVCKSLKNNQRLIYGKATSDDYKTTSMLFIHSKETNKVLPIIKISPRPSLEAIKKQLLNDQPTLLQSHIYDETVFQLDVKTNQNIGVEIFFSNLVLINLSKYHLAEVVNSCWDDQFMSFVKSNKIEIM
jgi:asparagine synthetase A